MTVNGAGVPNPLPKMHSGLRRRAQAHTRRPDPPPLPQSRADRVGQRRENNPALRQPPRSRVSYCARAGGPLHQACPVIGPLTF